MTFLGVSAGSGEASTPLTAITSPIAANIAKASPKPELACRRGSLTLGVCGKPGSLFPACSAAFKQSCETAGGSTSSCGPNGSDCAAVITCSDGSDLFHDCDEKFMMTCEDENTGGDFECTGKCDDGTCCTGTCTLPERSEFPGLTTP